MAVTNRYQCILILLSAALAVGSSPSVSYARGSGPLSLHRSRRGASSISIGPPTFYGEPGNHTVQVGMNIQLSCKIAANPLAHVAIKFNPEDRPITMVFPKYGTSPTGGKTIVYLDLDNLQLEDEGRYTCYGENEHGRVESHGWLKFGRVCNCNQYGVAFPQKPCDDDGNCVCRENVGGERCDECQEGFFNYPFCQPCECNPWGTIDQSLSCDQKTGECNCLPDRSIFDSVKCDGCQPGDYFDVVTSRCQPCQCFPTGSVSKDCDYISGQCECKEKYVGDKCSQCADGFYDRDRGCKPCECVVENTLRGEIRCDADSGQCLCKPGLAYSDERTCATCPANTYYTAAEGCVPCGCDPNGTERCGAGGECVCKDNFAGDRCQQCEASYYGYESGSCKPCECNEYGAISLQCDENGQCLCEDGYDLIDSVRCDGCPPGKTISQNAVEGESSVCVDCGCNPMGSLSYQCDLYTGECNCRTSVIGIHCDECEEGSYGFALFGECRPCGCDPENSLSSVCDENSGQCLCRDNMVFTDTRTCTGCQAGQYSKDGMCHDCGCNAEGSLSAQCDDSGQCICHPTVQGLKCDECKPGYFALSELGCTECGCNEFGVVDKNAPCDPVSGQCECLPGQDRISSRTCDGCEAGFYMNVNDPTQCFSCECHPHGSYDQECDLYTGACDCEENVEGTKCDSCEEGFYGLNVAGIEECVPCGCDPEGAMDTTCDVFGQCICHQGYGGIDSRTCEGCPPGQYPDNESGKCAPCACDPRGAVSDTCQTDGTCFCGDNVQSDKCDVCEAGHYFGEDDVPGCIPCGCDLSGTISADGSCDTNTGQCDCDDSLHFINSRTCEQCERNEYINNNLCTDCGCHPKGSTDLQCNVLTGQCSCNDGAEGKKCDSCQDGFYDSGDGCVPCACVTENTVNGDVTCDNTGQCNCVPDTAYSNSEKCAACEDGTYQKNGVCTPCDCHTGGSASGTCDGDTGQCQCLENVHGRRCDQCLGDTFGINSGEGCQECACNIHGTIDKSTSCDQVSGQCECLPGQDRYDARTCDGCAARDNAFLDPETRTCIPCECVDLGSNSLNCTLYEGICDCKTGVVGDKCDIIGQSKDDAVKYGDPAQLSCSLNKGAADRTEWVGPDGCVSMECGHPNILEESDYLSLNYVPEEDESYKCRFYFGEEYQEYTATVDVITYELPSIRVLKGSEVTLTTVVGGLQDRPNKGIEWRHKGDPCTERRCKIDGHGVTETRVKEEDEWTLISELYVGVVDENVRYTAFFKYKGRTFRTFTIVTVYDCNCYPEGSRSEVCDSITQQCDCKDNFMGVNCDQCMDEFYAPSSGCLACDCDTDHAVGNLCDKVTGQCACEEGITYVDPRRCTKCRDGTYLVDGECAACGCVTENTLADGCDDIGACFCNPSHTYLDPRICERCAPGTYLVDGACQECGCDETGSESLVCAEDSGECTCKSRYQGDKCDTCEDGFTRNEDGQCVPCNCDTSGSTSSVCDKETGQCECNFGHEGKTCDECQFAYYKDNGECRNCACNPIGVDTFDCDQNTGQCDCLPGYTGKQCDRCTEEYYQQNGRCRPCMCSEPGSIENTCNDDGQCTCRTGFHGDKCDTCQAEYYNTAEGCEPCNCDPDNSEHNECDVITGQCPCITENGPFLDPQRCGACADDTILEDGGCVKCPKGTFVVDNTCTYCWSEHYFSEGECKVCTCFPRGSRDNVCDPVSGVCTCKDNYEGANCDTCQEGHHSPSDGCLECDCVPENSLSLICDRDNGQCRCKDGLGPFRDPVTCDTCPANHVVVDGECVECTAGQYIEDNTCVFCPDTEYLLNGKCEPCVCGRGSGPVCDKVSGQCDCRDGFMGRTCDVCQEEYYGVDDCKPCECDPDGSVHNSCDRDSGKCICNEGHEGDKCSQCEYGFYKDDTNRCVDCECYSEGTGGDMTCDTERQCNCLPGYTGRACKECQDGYYESLGMCLPCGCSEPGSRSNACDRDGVCSCHTGYTGDKCEDCADEYYESDGECRECGCSFPGSVNNDCDDSGVCLCNRGYTGDKCETCQDEYYESDGECRECGCSFPGSVNNDCDDSGMCDCNDGFTGDKCNRCEVGYFSDRCIPCSCSPNALHIGCDELFGMCDCPENYAGQKCEECAPGYYGDGCLACMCDPTHSTSDICDQVTGQCPCSDESSSYQDPRTCQACPRNHRVAEDGSCVECDAGTILHSDNTCKQCPSGTYEVNGECQQCKCDPRGTDTCNHVTGACTCKPNYTGEFCDTCVAETYDPSSGCLECDCDPLNSRDNVCDGNTGSCDCIDPLYNVDPRTCKLCPEMYILGEGGACEMCPLGHFVEDNTCTLCDTGLYMLHGECTECRCNPYGSTSTVCDRVTGVCECDEKHEGEKCQNCRSGYYSVGGLFGDQQCEECGCVVENTLGGVVKECSWSGQCSCRGGLVFVNERTCETCPEGQVIVGGQCEECFMGTYYSGGVCRDCYCLFPGAESNICDPYTAECVCKEGYAGPQCGVCADGYYKQGNKCVPCLCDPDGSESSVCDKETGQCPCRASLDSYDVSRTCFKCPSYEYFHRNNGQCMPCGCDMAGSQSASCDSEGRCECLPNVEGRKCNQCAKNFFGLDSGSGCQPCDCNPYGVKVLLIFRDDKIERERDMSCDPITGQCNCAEFEISNNVYATKNRYNSRQCDGCPSQQYHKSAENRTCVDCNCHPEGSRDLNCHLYIGDCSCNPDIVGKYCDTRGCSFGVWTHSSCILTDPETCTGKKNRTRKEFITKGGDFSTIIKESTCDRVVTEEIYCRVRKPCV